MGQLVPWLTPSIQESLFGRTKSPAERLRENKRALTRAGRELERERIKLEGQEKKLIVDIKKAAKAGQMASRGVFESGQKSALILPRPLCLLASLQDHGKGSRTDKEIQSEILRNEDSIASCRAEDPGKEREPSKWRHAAAASSTDLDSSHFGVINKCQMRCEERLGYVSKTRGKPFAEDCPFGCTCVTCGSSLAALLSLLSRSPFPHAALPRPWAR